MDKDTAMGGAAGAFPVTGLSMIEGLSAHDPEISQIAFARLIAAYWKPVYKYLRLRWQVSTEDAKDWTQEFFTSVLEKNRLEHYNADAAKFRTYLRVCLDGFAANQMKAAGRLKRGGRATFVSLDFERVEHEIQAVPSNSADPEELFHKEWVRALFQEAVDELERDCAAEDRSLVFELFTRFDLDPPAERPTYAELARELDLTTTQVTNYLAAARRQFRSLVLKRLAEICATEAEFQAEASRLFGASAR